MGRMNEAMHELFREVDGLLEKMIEQQRDKVMKVAARFMPRATTEDVLQPHDFPVLERSPMFQFEDGTLSGLLAAQMALRAYFKDRAASPGC